MARQARRDIRFTFTGGEISPMLVGRADIERYYTSVQTLENYWVTQYGPAERRWGTRFVAEVKDSARKVRLHSFQFSTTQGYILEFGHLYMRVYKDGGQVQAGGAPVELATPYSETDLPDLQFTQSADVLFVVHPSFAPRKITRTSDTAWTISIINFLPPATAEQSTKPATLLGLAANTGVAEARTKDTTWLAADAGREVVSGAGRGVIETQSDGFKVKLRISDAFNATITAQTTTLSSVGTTVTFSANHGLAVDDFVVLDSGAQAGEIRRVAAVPNATQVTLDAAFSANQSAGTAWKKSLGLASGVWELLGAPNTQLTPSATGPKFAIITLTLATAGWRSSDVGKFVFVNNGICKITTVSTDTSASAQVFKSLKNTNAAAGGTWQLEDEAWTTEFGFPRAVTLYEGRAFYGGTAQFPQRIWGTAIGDLEDLGEGVDADDALSFDIASPLIDAVQWIEPGRRLFVGTFGAEHVVNSGIDDPISPVNVVLRDESDIGSPHIKPLRVEDALLFFNRGRNRLWELGFNFQRDAFVATDLTLFAEHLAGLGAGTYEAFAFAREPHRIVWLVRSDGILVGLTYSRGQNIIGAHRHKLGASAAGPAVVESVAAIQHWSDSYDTVWLVVKRTINGVTKRYIEYIDRTLQTDSSLTRDSGPPVSSVSGLGHLEGEEVWVIGDGVVQGKRTVTNGSVAVSPPASVVKVGLGYDSKLVTLKLQYPGAPSTTGLAKRISTIYVDFLNSVDAKVEGQSLSFGSLAAPFSGEQLIKDLGYDTMAQITVEQVRPLPQIIREIAAEVNIDEDRT